MTALLTLQSISKAFFGVYAVRDVTLNVPAGRILGLIGQNGAGKSTLMNLIGGVLAPDAGSMTFDGKPYVPRTPSDAVSAGIAFIHQELNLFTNLSIAENIFLGAFPQRRGFPFVGIDRAAMRRQSEALLEAVDLKVKPESPVEQLAPGERQLVEIAKALQLDARLIIFDEPTTSLTTRETRKLFEIMQRLRERGTTLIYISHILNDVLSLADEIAVMRDGELIAHAPRVEFDASRMISLMVGYSLDQLFPPRTSTPTQTPLLTLKGISQPGIVKDIGLTVNAGEVVGLFGLMGSGRTELARIIFGLDSFASGEIVIGGEVLRHTSVRESIRNRIAFVTENRREEGLLMTSAIAENIGLVSLPRYALPGVQVVDQPRLERAVGQAANQLQIKSGNIERQAAKALSGGNQQKVVIAKWLLSEPSLFIMDEPTRGIDVGAKYEIYSIINTLAAEGNGVLFISSEIEELMGMCDRIVVMSQGEIYGEFTRADFDKEAILRTAFREQATQKAGDHAADPA